MMDYFDGLVASKLFGQGSTPAPSGDELSDVMFYDYDGTVLYRYSKDEFLALSEMPPNPTREGLVAQGWNWSIEDAKEYVANHGMIDIGQIYITDDGATRLHVSLNEGTGKTFTAKWYQSIRAGVTVNWGDGSSSEVVNSTGTVTLPHEYKDFGNYIVSFAPSDNCTIYDVNGYDEVSKASIIEINVGEKYVHSSFTLSFNTKRVSFPRAFFNRSPNLGSAYSLEHVTFPPTYSSIYGGSFLYNLRSISLPSNYTTMSSYTQCTKLKRICVNENVTDVNFSFRSCYSMKDASISKFTRIMRDSVFNDCVSLTKFTIPETVSSIGGNVFNHCYGLKEIYVMPKTPPTLGSPFLSQKGTTILYVPAESLEAYKSATNWSAYADQMVGV